MLAKLPLADIIGAKPTVCKFAITVDMHNKPEAVVLEGKYWKRRLESVKAEYQKWRLYYKEKSGNRVMPKVRVSHLPHHLPHHLPVCSS